MIKIPIRKSHKFCQNSQRARTSNFTPLEAVEPLCKITRKMTQTVQRFVHGLSLACPWLVPNRDASVPNRDALFFNRNRYLTQHFSYIYGRFFKQKSFPYSAFFIHLRLFNPWRIIWFLFQTSVRRLVRVIRPVGG